MAVMDHRTGPDDAEERLRALYAAFNDRDLDRVLAATTPDVDWPNGGEGGRLHGHAELRAYWERQWRQVRARLTPLSLARQDDATVVVRVRQTFRDPTGSVLLRETVRHTFTFDGDLVARMDASR